jgi:hypothetical protein
MANEKTNWDSQKKHAEDALDFWIDFLGIVDKDGKPISEKCKKCLMCIIRLISFVESQHGTAGKNAPERDPMQSGNPNDSWHRAITGADEEKLKKERIVRGEKKKNLWAEEIQDAVASELKLPKDVVPIPKTGHKAKTFTPAMSYFWGILCLIQKLNKPKTYSLIDCSWPKLVGAAVNYNGAGDSEYKEKIEKAGKDIDCDGCDKK